MRVRLVRLGRLAGGAAIVAVAMVAAPMAAAGQAGTPRPALPLQPETRTAIQRLADSLRAAKIPADPLYDKAAEGVLKGADDTRILRAVRSLAGELVAARGALGSSATDAEILAAASALHAGVPIDALRTLAASRGKRRAAASLAVPLTVLADLVTRRVPPDVAVESVEALIMRGATDDAFAALRAEVQRDILSGTAPAAAASARTRALVQTGERPEPPGGGSLP
jgi:hypothetical protein